MKELDELQYLLEDQKRVVEALTLKLARLRCAAERVVRQFEGVEKWPTMGIEEELKDV